MTERKRYRVWRRIIRSETLRMSGFAFAAAFVLGTGYGALDSAMPVVFLCIALSGYAAAFFGRGTRATHYLPALLISAFVYAVTLSFLVLGPPRWSANIGSHWLVALGETFGSRQVWEILGAVGFVFLMAGLVGVVVRGTVTLLGRFRVSVPVGIAVVATATVVAISVDGLHREGMERQVRNAGYCRMDADCVQIPLERDAGIGCYVAVNAAETEKVSALMSSSVLTEGRVCRDIPGLHPICRSGRCVMTTRAVELRNSR